MPRLACCTCNATFLQYYRGMQLKEKVEHLSELLEQLGEPTTTYKLAQLLSVNHATVTRWVKNQTRRIQSDYTRRAINTLDRVLKLAANGNGKAKECVSGAFSRHPDIMRRVEAAAVVFGITWLMKEEEESARENPVTEKDPSPHTTRSGRSPKTARRPSKRSAAS